MNLINERVGENGCRCDRCSGPNVEDFTTLWGVVELVWMNRESEDCLDVDFEQLKDLWSCSGEAKDLAFDLEYETVAGAARIFQNLYNHRLDEKWYVNHGRADNYGKDAYNLAMRLHRYLN